MLRSRLGPWHPPLRRFLAPPSRSLPSPVFRVIRVNPLNKRDYLHVSGTEDKLYDRIHVYARAVQLTARMSASRCRSSSKRWVVQVAPIFFYAVDGAGVDVNPVVKLTFRT